MIIITIIIISSSSGGRMYTVSQKDCAKLFLSELRQISTNFGNLWQKDGKETETMWGVLIFHLNYFASAHYRVKRKCSNLLHNAVISIRLLTVYCIINSIKKAPRDLISLWD